MPQPFTNPLTSVRERRNFLVMEHFNNDQFDVLREFVSKNKQGKNVDIATLGIISFDNFGRFLGETDKFFNRVSIFEYSRNKKSFVVELNDKTIEELKKRLIDF